MGSAANMKKVAEVVRHEGARITVLSAMSGTTDALVKIVAAAAAGDRDTVENQLAMLTDKYTTCIDGVLGAHREEALGRMKAAFELIRSEVGAFREYTSERTIIAQGELLTSAIFTLYLNETGMKAVCLNSPDFMVTDEDGKVDTCRLREALAPVAADQDTFYVAQGFICTNNRSEIDNLGRGGSDTSAVAIAAALKADKCEIYTDVDGVYTTDPRIVPNAHKLDEITYDEMLELATCGANVLHNRSVEMAKKYSVKMEVRSSIHSDVPGTIVKEVCKVEKMLIKGVALDNDVTRISVIEVPDQPGIAFRIFSALAASKINVDIILQSVGREGTKDISFTVSTAHKDAAMQIAEAFCQTVGGKEVNFNDNVAKVSIVGAGMLSNPGVAATMFEALGENNINISMISTSEIKISVLIEKEQGKKAVNAIHDAFAL